MKKIMLIILLATAVFAQSYNKEEALAILKPYMEEFIQLAKENRHAESIKFYDDEVMDMVPFREPIVGINHMRREIQKNIAAGMRYHSVDGETLNAWGCDDMIYEQGTLAFTQTTKANPKPQTYYGSYFTIWKKQADGSWKMKYTLWNLDFNIFAQ